MTYILQQNIRLIFKISVYDVWHFLQNWCRLLQVSKNQGATFLPTLTKLLNMRLFKSWHCIWIKYTEFSWRCNYIKNLLTAEIVHFSKARSNVSHNISTCLAANWAAAGIMEVKHDKRIHRKITERGFKVEKTAEIPVKKTELDPLFESIG